MHNFLSEIGYSYDTLLDKLTKPCSVIIRECVWRSKKFECSKLFRKVFTMMGYCCQFDVSYFREQVEDDLNFNCGVELSEGLDMIVNTQSISYNGSVVDSYLNMYVSDNQTKLNLLDRPIVFTEKYFFDITLAVWAIDSSEDVKRLSLKHRKCFLSEDTPEGANSFQNCIMFNILENVTAQCRCLPFNYEHYIQSDLKYRTLEQGCYQRCDHVQYDTEVTSLKIDRNVDNLHRGESRVNVHFSDNTCMKYRREVLYTWDQMLANLGGIFGLCLGGSIVSIIELIWFFLEISLIVMRFKQNNVNPQANIKNAYLKKN
ncbi:sodium channel protein Nach-like [Danaus plexippus]|uniref:sodium channel protein Nach-like n=1 Tax=Danaus plexippus TaxID=13037 RepID=UPI002AB26674|nr:sodium channel protein Nach-like [Danaus plexippus]